MIEISDISSGNIIELTQPNNLSKAILPPHHAVGFRYFFYRLPRAYAAGLPSGAHMRGLYNCMLRMIHPTHHLAPQGDLTKPATGLI